MNDSSSEEYLEEYVEGTHRKKGATVAIVLLSLLLVAAGGAAVYLGKLWSEGETKVLQAQREMETATG